ncbi:DUF551 domain-containing protein, partial [Salmonella enterica]
DPEKATIWLNNYSGTCVQEYVKLERLQEALSGNSPVTPDGWIPVSERMPDNGGKFRELYLCYGSYFDGDKPDYIPAYFFIHPTNGWSEWEPVEDDCNPKSVIITHWMPLPAAPQQEVKS